MKLLVQMTLWNKWVSPSVHAAVVERQCIEGEWIDILCMPVVFMVDAFPCTNDISGVMWQMGEMFCCFARVCFHPNLMKRFLGWMAVKAVRSTGSIFRIFCAHCLVNGLKIVQLKCV